MQRQLKRKGHGDSKVSAPGSALPSTSATDAKSEPGLEAENIRLRQEVENLEGELECAADTDAELAAKVLTLRERVKALEPYDPHRDLSDDELRELVAKIEQTKILEAEAAAAGQLRQRVKELEGQLAHMTHTQAAMRQGAGCFREAPGATFQLQDDLGVGGQSQCLGKEPNYLTERKGGLTAVLARPKEDTVATMDLYRRLEEMGVEARA